jgi:hypothetical protein
VRSVLVRLRDHARRERWFLLATGFVTFLGALFRASTLSSGSLFRDDAWVALTTQHDVTTAWRMVGPAPLFTMVERGWIGLQPHCTLWAQTPTFLVSISAIALVALGLRYLGLSEVASVFGALCIAVSKTDINYATHLKPYAHDLVAATVILVAAQWWSRGRSAWPFALLALLCLATSLTVLPLVAGVALVMSYQAWRDERLASLRWPGLTLASVMVGLYFAVRRGLSPALKESWSANFVNFHSPSLFVHSSWNILQGLVAGFFDTTPHLHIPGFAKGVLVLFILLAILGLWRRREPALYAAAAVVGAVVACLSHVVPMGTGRTDAYLYPAIALLVGNGIDVVRHELSRHRRYWSFGFLVLLGLISLVGVNDRLAHRAHYPGGDIRPVAAEVRNFVHAGGSVIIEGTAQWPWVYYEAPHASLSFSTLYNTGFTTNASSPHIKVMHGTVIEGEYRPAAELTALGTPRTLMIVEAADWLNMPQEFRPVLLREGYHRTSRRVVHGFVIQIWQR